MIAFAGVVVHDVENDLDARRVERLHHALELVDLIAESFRGVANVGREEADRVVAPVVREPAFGEMPVDDELVHGQQLDRGDAEREEVLDHRIAAEAEVRAAKILRHFGMQLRHAFDMALVDDRAIPRNAQRAIFFPCECRIDDHAFRNAAGAVVRIGLEVFVRRRRLCRRRARCST